MLNLKISSGNLLSRHSFNAIQTFQILIGNSVSEQLRFEHGVGVGVRVRVGVGVGVAVVVGVEPAVWVGVVINAFQAFLILNWKSLFRAGRGRVWYGVGVGVG